MKITNVVESMVWEVLDSLLAQNPSVCHCDKCRADMAAYALNRLTPHYAASRKGEVLIKAGSLDSKTKVALLVALTEAMQVVSANPLHDKE